MHMIVDLFIDDQVVVEPNGSNSGITIRDEDSFAPRATIYLGNTVAEVEANRRRLNEAIDLALSNGGPH